MAIFAILPIFGQLVSSGQLLADKQSIGAWQKNVVGTRGSVKAQLSILGKTNDNL